MEATRKRQGLKQFHGFSDEVLRALAKLVEREQKERPGARVTESEVVVGLILKAARE